MMQLDECRLEMALTGGYHSYSDACSSSQLGNLRFSPQAGVVGNLMCNYRCCYIYTTAGGEGKMV